MSKVVVAMGSNLGESLDTLDAAINTLLDHPKIQLLARSSWYRTKPIGPPQPDYCNGCILIDTSIEDPHVLLDLLQKVENDYGRERNERWGPRTLDLDIIFLGQECIDTDRLKVPHPRVQERAFVLEPLAEIAPHMVDPRSGKTITQLLSLLEPQGVEKIVKPVLV